MKDPVGVLGRWRGFFSFGVAWKESRAIAKELVLPIVVLLALRLRKLLPHHQDRHYDGSSATLPKR